MEGDTLRTDGDNPMPQRSDRARQAAKARRRREQRQALAESVAAPYDGRATIAMLVAAGLTRRQVRGEVERGALTRAGRHTLRITGATDAARAQWWTALWESGSRAVLDGPTALLASGLTSWTEQVIHVSVPNGATVRPLEGVVHHRLRDIGPVLSAGLRRTRPEVAVIRSAQWAVSDRQAATIVAMTVQQASCRAGRAARPLVTDSLLRSPEPAARGHPRRLQRGTLAGRAGLRTGVPTPGAA